MGWKSTPCILKVVSRACFGLLQFVIFDFSNSIVNLVRSQTLLKNCTLFGTRGQIQERASNLFVNFLRFQNSYRSSLMNIRLSHMNTISLLFTTGFMFNYLMLIFIFVDCFYQFPWIQNHLNVVLSISTIRFRT